MVSRRPRRLPAIAFTHSGYFEGPAQLGRAIYSKGLTANVGNGDGRGQVGFPACMHAHFAMGSGQGRLIN